MVRPRITIGRAPGWRSDSASRSLPTRTSNPRREAPARRLPFSMKPMPPNIFTSLTAPALLTAARTHACSSSSFMALLRVLHLLAHLLDDHLHVDRGACGLEILRLGRERIRLAVELLHEKVEAPPGGLAAADHAAHLGDVAGEALELLVDVEPLQQQRELLLDALVIDGAGQLGEALLEPGTGARLHLGHTRAHRTDESLERAAALLEELAQPLPFAGARRREILERRGEQGSGGREQRLAAHGVFAQHAGPAQHVEHVDGRRAVERAAHGLRRVQQPLERARVHLEGPADARRSAVAHAAVDLAAPHFLREARAQLALGRAQLVR